MRVLLFLGGLIVAGLIVSNRATTSHQQLKRIENQIEMQHMQMKLMDDVRKSLNTPLISR